MNSSITEQRSVSGSYERVSEFSGSMETRECLEMSDKEVSNKDSLRRESFRKLHLVNCKELIDVADVQQVTEFVSGTLTT